MNQKIKDRRTWNPGALAASAAAGLLWVLVAGVPGLLGATQQGTLPWKPAQGTEESYQGNEMCVMCHFDRGETFPANPHAGAGAKVEHPAGDLTCEACHGPGLDHVNAGGDPAEMENFTEKTAAGTAEACLACHAGSLKHAGFLASAHAAGEVSCSKCHSIHSADVSLGLLKASPPKMCLACHQGVLADFTAADRHGLKKGLVSCEDCHNPHGSAEAAMLVRPMMGGELCVKCHAGKRGPFVYEHLAGTVEGCTACHTSHGSANRFMLKTNRTSELCVMCHVEAPTVHNMAEPRYQNCTTCHTAIHGSDTHYLFFRR